jgi:CBS domain-containing protein
MKTSAISQRVADFLKQHPPFEFMEEEDLLQLAWRGRVKFHESDEFIFWQGKAPAQFVFVIQQGAVALMEEGADGERLRDIRGKGDMLGVDRFFGAETWPYSAKTSSDVILYALPADEFEPLLSKYPRARRYLEAQALVAPDFDPLAGTGTAHRSPLPREFGRKPVTCQGGEAIRDVAKRMSERDASAAAVLDPDGRPAGLVTMKVLRDRVATGEVSVTGPVELVMRRRPPAAPPGRSASEYALAMLREDHGALVLTEDGTLNKRLHGILTPEDLSQVFGDNPVELVQRVAAAPDAVSLQVLHQRFRALFASLLSEPAAVSWLGKLAGEFNVAMLRRLLKLVNAEHDLDAIDHCWCFYGAGGREELLTPVVSRLALVYEDIPEGGAHIQERLSTLCHHLQNAFVNCGYIRPRDNENSDYTACDSLSGWRDSFNGWIFHPVLKQMYESRPCFDLRAVLGNRQLVQTLSAQVRSEINANGSFINLLAHDSLANLPPLTLYRGLVVDEAGRQAEELEIERNAIRPLVDVGRAVGLAAGRLFDCSTSERFQTAAASTPEERALFEEAAGALQLALYHQAREGIRRSSDGAVLDPAVLSRYDQQLLKRSFRSILRLLEYASRAFTLEGL